jgi:hypothetical protein
MLTVDWNSNTGWAEPKIETCELDRVMRWRWHQRQCGLLNLVDLTGAIVIARDRRTSQFGPFFRRVPLCLLSVSAHFYPVIPMHEGVDSGTLKLNNKSLTPAFLYVVLNQFRRDEGLPMRRWDHPALPTGYEHAPDEQGRF